MLHIFQQHSAIHNFYGGWFEHNKHTNLTTCTPMSNGCMWTTYTEQVFQRFIWTCDNPQFITRDEMQSGGTRQWVRQLQYVRCIGTEQSTAKNTFHTARHSSFTNQLSTWMTSATSTQPHLQHMASYESYHCNLVICRRHFKVDG